ncbi:hypothetical protein GGI35DRAFT_294345 [Trichoderma velutinum]
MRRTDLEMTMTPVTLATDTIAGLHRRGHMTTMETHTDERCLIACVPIPGFALEGREWAKFGVDKLRSIEWIPDIWSKLVLHSEEKELVLSLLTQRPRRSSRTSSLVKVGRKATAFFAYRSRDANAIMPSSWRWQDLDCRDHY